MKHRAKRNLCPKFASENVRAALPQWHVNCGHNLRIERMATKIKMLKLLQEADALAEVDRRPPRPALYMMQMRSRSFQPSLPKRRLPIRINPEDYALPKPVQIILLKPKDEA